MRVSFQRLVHLMRTNSVSGAFREWSEQSTPEAIRDAGKALFDELTALRAETRFSGPRCEWCGKRPPCDPKGCPGPPGRKRWGIVQVSPGGVTIWVEPHDGEDRAPDPDGDEWTPLFLTPAEAAHAITQRPRYEVRELPTRADRS